MKSCILPYIVNIIKHTLAKRVHHVISPLKIPTPSFSETQKPFHSEPKKSSISTFNTLKEKRKKTIEMLHNRDRPNHMVGPLSSILVPNHSNLTRSIGAKKSIKFVVRSLVLTNEPTNCVGMKPQSFVLNSNIGQIVNFHSMNVLELPKQVYEMTFGFFLQREAPKVRRMTLHPKDNSHSYIPIH